MSLREDATASSIGDLGVPPFEGHDEVIWTQGDRDVYLQASEYDGAVLQKRVMDDGKVLLTNLW